MKSAYIYIYIIITLFVLYACKGEWMKKWQIGDNYYFTYDSSWGFAYIMNTTHGIVINMEIVAWNYDSIFIIVKQKPFYSLSDSILMEHPNTPLAYREKLYKEYQLYNYWIIDKREEFEFYYDEKNNLRRENAKAVLGPFTYDEYWAKRKELNVPDSLKLLESERNSFPSPIHSLFYDWFYKPPDRERVVE